MKMAHVCFVVAGLSALSAATLSLAVTYQDQWCYWTPVSACNNPCGCPIGNTPTDFCSGGVPPNGYTEVTMFFCISSNPGVTCTSPDPQNYCGGSVVSCVNKDGTTCSCCGNGVTPPCYNMNCGWWCTQPCQATTKPGACGAYYGCTTP